jgi:hypothetical protein
VRRRRSVRRPDDPYRPDRAAITGIRLAMRAGAIAASTAASTPNAAIGSSSSGRMTGPA